MAGLNIALETAKRALFTQQTAITVTGHNIANVNTPGFSRQRADLVPALSLQVPGGRVGTGVTVSTIERIYDRFLAGQINAQIQNKGKSEAEQHILDQVQAIFNETSGTGLNKALSDFWNAWQSLATNPTGAAERSGLMAKTTTLTQLVRDADGRLSTLQSDINKNVQGDVDHVNLLTNEIASLNLAIKQAESGGQQPANDLRDRQQGLVDQLAELLPVQIFQQGDGQLGLQLPGGKPLVNGSSVWELTTTVVGGLTQVQWLDQAGTPMDITNQLSQGELGGLIDARDTLLAGYRRQLDTLAAGLIIAVNTLHSTGIGLTPFSSLTSAQAVDDTATPLSSSAAGLPFGNTIVDGSFQVFVYDSTGAVTGSGTVTIDAATTSLADVQSAFSAIPGLTASIDASTGTLSISGASGRTFAFGADTSHVLAALGLNTLFTGSKASDIAVAPLVQSNPDRLAAAQLDDANGAFAAGDNRTAAAIAALQTTALTLDGTSRTLDDYYGMLVGQIGTDAQRAEQDVVYQGAILEQLNNRRDAISGVSIDEEMTNLVKFQQAYSAAARLITRVDEMMRTVIEMV
jgi:flagellar hook-associated protein 1 FlgK